VDVFRDRWNKKRVDLAEAAGDEGDFDLLFKENDRWQPSEMPARACERVVAEAKAEQHK